MRTFWNIEKNLTAINEWQPNCWIQVTCPTDEDQKLLEEKFNIPDYFLSISAIPMSVPATNMTTAGCSSFCVFPMSRR